jgi:hypothetical protein
VVDEKIINNALPDDAYIQATDNFFNVLSNENVDESFKRIKPDLQDFTFDATGHPISYERSTARKPEKTELALSKEHIEELTHCYNHPIYTIKNYFKIVSVDKGIVNFNLYNYQCKFIKDCLLNKKVIARWPRQAGKCLNSINSITYIKKPSNIFKKLLYFCFKKYMKFNIID